MRDKNLLLLIFSMFLFTAAPALFAQPPLTETYTSVDGKFSINYSAGWDVSEDDDLIGFRGDGILFQINFYDNGNSGYEPITPLEYLEVGIDSDPEIRATMEFSEPEELLVGGFPALVSSSPLMEQHYTVIDFGNGILGKAIGYGNPASIEPTIMAMMQSIQYGDGPVPVAETPLDDIQPITAANAAQVAQLMTLGDASVSIASVALNLDGDVIAAAGSDGSVNLWDIATGESRFVLEGHTDGATSVAFGAGGYMLAVGSGNGQVRSWDVTTGEGMGILQEHDTSVESVAFLPDGFLVASGSLDNSVHVWDMATGAEQSAIDNLTPVVSVAFSPDGATLAVGGGNTIRLWDVATGSEQAVLETEISEISSVAFSPDGTWLAYGGSDPAVWVWDLASDNHVLLEGHDGQVSALVFSPDGSVIASGDSGTVRLWDAATGANLVELASPVNSLAFNSDGTLLVSGGESDGVVLWGTASDSGPVEEAAASENSGETAEIEETTTSASACTITAPNNANLRGGPGTEFDRAGSLSAGQTAEVDGQTQGADGMTWYRLTDGAWVRSDVVGTPAECANASVVTP